MNNYAKKSFFIIAVGVFFMPIFFNTSCANTKPNKLRNKIQRMSDTDLLNYYYGINEGIKDIDHGMKREEHLDHTEHEHYIFQTPFTIGGEGYNLIQERKVVLKELNKRNISP